VLLATEYRMIQMELRTEQGKDKNGRKFPFILPPKFPFKLHTAHGLKLLEYQPWDF
jgi:hypothetical protein